MNRRDLLVFLGLELFAIVWAASVFKLIPVRVVAGAVAGTYFVLSGLYMTTRAWKWTDRWTSFSFYPLLTHVFAIAIPWLVVRAIHSDQPFERVQILGLSGPQLHQLSSWIFLSLMVGTVLDLLRVLVRKRHPLK